MTCAFRSCYARLLLLLAATLSAVDIASAEPTSPKYNRDIRPILAENCFACHGPDSASRKADLRLDRRESAIEAKAIVPSNIDESELLRRINSTDDDERMPPPTTGKKLTADQIEQIRLWIQEGAEYEPHWSFQNPQRPGLPVVSNANWVRNPIDAFVLARLEHEGVQPAPEANRKTLARRLSLDLTGLPPSPEMVEQFVQDDAPDAYEKFVDELLNSPHYGEQRAHYWLDAARYADTHGLHFDNFREMSTYRDEIIGAFNRNQPFDQFTIEQLAGDLLPEATVDQQIASGFNRCHVTTNEAGIIDDEYLVLYARDRTETVSQIWLGLTTGCAVCHDHKFDPISQKEFYELSAFFNNTSQPAKDDNAKAAKPVLYLPRREDQQRWSELPHEIEDVKCEWEEQKQQSRPDFERWLETTTQSDFIVPKLQDDLEVHASLSEDTDKDLSVEISGIVRTLEISHPDWVAGPLNAKGLKLASESKVVSPDIADFEKDQPFSLAIWVNVPRSDTTGALCARMDDQNGFRGWDVWLEGNQVGMHLVNQWPESAIKVVCRSKLKAGEWHHVLVTYDGSETPNGIRIYYDGLAQATQIQADNLKETIHTGVPFKLAQRDSGSRINDIAFQDLRIYRKVIDAKDAAALFRSVRMAELIAKPSDTRTDSEKEELLDWWLKEIYPPTIALKAKETLLKEEESKIRDSSRIAYVMQEKATPPSAFVLYRGDYEQRRDEVKPEVPSFLPAMSEGMSHNRLGFAQWLLRPDHPLTSRVTVNRFWQQLFGTGLVRTAGDFGIAGELPSNQELLDWLAVEFRESGWDVKHLLKLMVTSSTYRQSAEVTKEKLEKDPENRWLARGPRFRMDAEMIRDYALCASGLLVPKIGGPSVKPYQPDNIWESIAMPESNTRKYVRDTGNDLYRRSLYTFWKRAAPPASMEIFNAPSREKCVVCRERTNTPLQALVTLNDPQFVEAARVLAQMAITKSDDPDSRLQLIARRLLIRELKSEELAIAKSSLILLLEYYTSHPDMASKLISVGESEADPQIAPAVLASWTMLATEMMNLDEVLNK